MRAWTSVKVKDDAMIGKKAHPRAGLAGQTTTQTTDDAAEVEVKFDVDNVAETVKDSDLQAL